MKMKQMLIWLMCLVLLLALAPGAALAGMLEKEPLAAAEQDAIPAIAPDPTIQPTTWSVPKTFRATRGGTYQLVEVSPLDRSLPTIYAQSSKPDIVSVNDRGQITAKELGKATITIKGADRKLIKCGVEVVPNSVSRKKAARGVPGEVVTSTKSMHYEGGKLVLEVYVLNRTGATIYRADGLVLRLQRGDAVLFEHDIPTWTSKSGFRSGAQKVYKTSISKDEQRTFTDELLDLGSGEYTAVIVGWGGIWTDGVEIPQAEQPEEEPAQMPEVLPIEIEPVAPFESEE